MAPGLEEYQPLRAYPQPGKLLDTDTGTTDTAQAITGTKEATSTMSITPAARTRTTTTNTVNKQPQTPLSVATFTLLTKNQQTSNVNNTISTQNNSSQP